MKKVNVETGSSYQLETAKEQQNKQEVTKMSKKAKKGKVEILVVKSNEVYDARTPNLGIGAQARECIKAGMNFQDTYALIKGRVPHTKFSKRCYYWYRSHLLMDGVKLPFKKQEVKAVKAA